MSIPGKRKEKIICHKVFHECLAFFGIITDTVRSYSIFLVFAIKFVPDETSADDPTEENGTFLF
jgi:hypothetical protein